MSVELYDWLDTRRQDAIHVYMLSPTGNNEVLGELEGVILSSSSLDYGYYSDTRVSASITYAGDSWIRGTFLRIVHEVPEWGYTNTLGTFIVTSEDASLERGVWRTTLTLHSMLMPLSTELLTAPLTRAQGASALTTFGTLCTKAGRRYNTSGANDAVASSAEVYEAGSTIITHLFDLCDSANNRLDVAPDGTIVAEPYVLPAAKTAQWTLDTEAIRGTTTGALSRSSNGLEMPDTVAVQYTYQDDENNDREIIGVAKLTNSQYSASERGYSITDFRSITDMTPATQARADELAKTYLAKQTTEKVEWDVTSIYLPLWEGDVVNVVVRDGDTNYQGTRKCLVKSASIALDTLQMDLVLKETASGDWEDSDE
jgi:hypothetical protein